MHPGLKRNVLGVWKNIRMYLFITGTFYDSITADRIDSGLRFSTKGFTDGSSIEKKYGEQILGIGDTAKEYFNIMYLRPWMERFFSECGYR